MITRLDFHIYYIYVIGKKYNNNNDRQNCISESLHVTLEDAQHKNELTSSSWLRRDLHYLVLIVHIMAIPVKKSFSICCFQTKNNTKPSLTFTPQIPRWVSQSILLTLCNTLSDPVRFHNVFVLYSVCVGFPIFLSAVCIFLWYYIALFWFKIFDATDNKRN